MKNFVYSVTFLTILSFFNLAQAAVNAGTVVMLRGTVTKLVPGSHVAQEVVMGDKIPEHTSIVTGDASLVKIKLKNKSTLSLGPKSKVVVEESHAGAPGMIKLLGGHIRSQVEKMGNGKPNGKTKLLIKTRSAAMGVRGTDFSVVFNPENKITSLVTIDGKVTMAKVDEASMIQGKGDHQKLVIDSKALDKALGSKDSVNVIEGRYAGLLPEHGKVTLPVKISPAQVEALQQTTEVKKDTTDYESQNLKEAPPEGVDNNSTGEFAARSGGVVDFNTGIYVPPPENAKFDADTKTYVLPKSYGVVNKETGDYVPPKGMVLDATQGFMAKRDNDEDVVAQTKLMNKNIQEEIKVASHKAPIDPFWSEIFHEDHNPFTGKTHLEFGYDSNVTQKQYYETIFVTFENSPYFRLNGDLIYKHKFNDDWEMENALNLFLHYNTRVHNDNVYQFTNGSGELSSKLTRLHTVAYMPAFFSVKIGGYQQEMMASTHKSTLSPFVRDFNLTIEEKFHATEMVTLGISGERKEYTDFRSAMRDHGHYHVLRLFNENKYHEQIKHISSFDLIKKAASHPAFDANYANINTRFNFTDENAENMLVLAFNYKFTHRLAAQYRGKEREYSPHIGYNHFISHDVVFGTFYEYARQFSEAKFDFDFEKHRMGINLDVRF